MHLFDRFSNLISRGTGKPATFVAACGLIVLWAVVGPLFGFSETWQLVVNTATTIITFLMVFVLQHTQNQDGEAVQAKLDELIFALKHADNRLIGAEHLDVKELRRLRDLIAEQVRRGEEKIEQIDQKAEKLRREGRGETTSAEAFGSRRYLHSLPATNCADRHFSSHRTRQRSVE